MYRCIKPCFTVSSNLRILLRFSLLRTLLFRHQKADLIFRFSATRTFTFGKNWQSLAEYYFGLIDHVDINKCRVGTKNSNQSLSSKKDFSTVSMILLLQ